VKPTVSWPSVTAVVNVAVVLSPRAEVRRVWATPSSVTVALVPDAELNPSPMVTVTS